MKPSSIVLMVLLCCAAGSWAGPEKKIAPFKAQVSALSSWSKTVTFKGGERASVIVIGGNVPAHLGLYIMDEHGNCVTRDDSPGGEYLNDRAVVWYPAKTQQYTIQVRNFSPIADTFHIGIR